MSERTLTINGQQAIEWWLSDDKTLQTLVLQVYTEEELQWFITKTLREQVVDTNKDCMATATWTKLCHLAKLFNKDWVKTSNNKGYFICSPNTVSYKAKCDDFCILSHERVIYPGLVYFKDIESAKKAIKILGNDLNYLI